MIIKERIKINSLSLFCKDCFFHLIVVHLPLKCCSLILKLVVASCVPSSYITFIYNGIIFSQLVERVSTFSYLKLPVQPHVVYLDSYTLVNHKNKWEILIIILATKRYSSSKHYIHTGVQASTTQCLCQARINGEASQKTQPKIPLKRTYSLFFFLLLL